MRDRMITAYRTGRRITATEKAKEIIMEKLEIAVNYYFESAMITDLNTPLTEREMSLVEEALNKKLESIGNYLGMSKLDQKLN